MPFQLQAPYKPAGDQPTAIAQLTDSILAGEPHQVLLGVTGSGKSLGYHDPVFVATKSDEGNLHLRVQAIGPLIDEAMKGRLTHTTDDHEILHLAGGDCTYLAQAFDPVTGEVSLHPISAFTRHAPTQRMFRLRTACGREATFTADHNLWVLRDGALCLIKTEEAKPTDYIPLPETLPEGAGIPYIGLNEALRGSTRTLYMEQGVRTGRVRSLQKRFTHTDSWGIKTIHKPLLDVYERQTLSHWNDFPQNENRSIESMVIRTGRGWNALPARLSMTPNLLRLLGYYIAEGCSNGSFIVLANRDAGIRKDIEAALNELRLPIAVRKNSDYQISSALLAEWLGSECGQKSFGKKLPSFWADFTNVQLAILLRAYFDGDGFVEKGRSVCAMTASKTLASDLQYALLRFGIWARVQHRWKRTTNTGHDGAFYCQVSISGGDNLQKFAAAIGFSLPYKTEALQALLGKPQNSNVDVVPILPADLTQLRVGIGLTAKRLGQLAGLSRPAIHLMEYGQRRPQRKSLLSILRALRQEAVSNDPGADWWQILQKLEALCRLRWTPVASLEAEAYTHPFVYDFSVPGPETFLAGSGGFFVHNTFTMANVIQNVQRPTLVLTHNKTLVAQLYGEFKQFFPDNAVEYFVSYYDYYQPEAYLPTTDTYIEKDQNINEELDKLRLRATTSLLSGRRDIIVVASVSCIYGMGNPTDYESGIIRIAPGDKVSRQQFLHAMVNSLYNRTTGDFTRGTFRVKGDTVDINLPYLDIAYRVSFFGDEIESIESIEVESGKRIAKLDDAAIFPANLYVAPKDILQDVMHAIQDEMRAQVDYFTSVGKFIEAQRLKERVEYDLEMIRELGFCNGIENYSRFFDRRQPGSRPFCLLDYFPRDFVTMIDESHQTVSQISGMYGGDRSRKITLVDYGFRLPSAMDNRPLNFHEFEALQNQIVYVSATPGDYELEKTGGAVVEQVVRPTGLIEPPIEVRPSVNQIDDLLEEIDGRVKRGDRVLVTTLTKRMAEEMDKYLGRINIKSKYIHSDVDTLERIEILRELRLGTIDVLVGVNLLREGLDLPEVSLVAILDADKEGFLRNERSLTQTAGRAARNVDGLVIFYADKITESMQRTIDETDRRRAKQVQYNTLHGITPRSVGMGKEQIMAQTSVLNIKGYNPDSPYATEEAPRLALAAEEGEEYSTIPQLEKAIGKVKKEMEKAARDMDFMEAARLRDAMFGMQKKLEGMKISA